MARRKAQPQETTARQAKLAALRAQEARKRRQMTIVMGAIGLVLVVIVAFIIVYASTRSNGSSTPAASSKTAKVVNTVTSIPESVFNQVGTGSVDPKAAPQPIPGNHSLTADGKPKVLYVGAEYCPYCATERWAVVAALSRFGTFNDLGTTSSTPNDAFPNTATLSFHGASYSSKYLSFAGYETQDRQGAPLDKMTPEDQKVFQTFDAPPYTQGRGSIPFIDFGGKYMIVGASYDAGVLQGKTHLEIAKAMHDPNSDIAQGADAVANQISARLCTLTDQQPASVCTSPGVTAAAKAMNGS